MNNMTPIDILIVEDEAILALDLSNTLTKQGYRVVGTAGNGPMAMDLFKQHSVDLLLCDIHLPGPFNGIEVVQRVQQIRPIPVIYLTGYTDHQTFDLAKETQPAAYMVKPYQLINLRNSIELAFYLSAQNNTDDAILSKNETETVPLNHDKILRIDNYIFIKQEYRFVKIALDTVLFIEADSNYIKIVTHIKKYLLRMSLSVFLNKVGFTTFVRIHRSFAVNIIHIDSFNENTVTIQKNTINISRQYKNSFLSSFNIQ